MFLYIYINRSCLKSMLLSIVSYVKLLLQVALLALVKFSLIGGKNSSSMGNIVPILQMPKLLFRMCVTAMNLSIRKLL